MNSNGAGAWSEVTTVASEQADQPPQPNVPEAVDESQTSAFQLSFSMPARRGAPVPITGYKVQLTSGAETTVVELADLGRASMGALWVWAGSRRSRRTTRSS